jgi:hypothetical protein
MFGFTCDCHSGFQKFENGTEPTCVDVDECQESNGGCQHACQNLVHKIVSDIKEL